jgi:L-threonylcarbamoyladenylate synthase
MDAFWPGPLSLVLPKHKDVPDITTGGLDTVVKHPVAQALI